MPKYKILSVILIVGVTASAGCGSSAVSNARSEQSPRSTYNPAAAGETFGDMVSARVHGRAEPVGGIDDAIKKRQTVIVGEVVDLVEGRRRPLGDGSDPSFYVQYHDVVIRPTAVIKGNASTRADVHVEFIWPRNLPTAELSAALPRGARAIVLGDRSSDAGATSHTLLSVPGYGLVFETADGATALPFDHDAPVNKSLPGAKNSFAELHAAVAKTR